MRLSWLPLLLSLLLTLPGAVWAAEAPETMTRWYGAYMQGQKIGYAEIGERMATWAGKPAVESYMDSHFEIKLLGQTNTITLQESEFTHPDTAELVGATSLMSTGVAAMDQNTRITRTGNDLLVEFLIAGVVSSSEHHPWTAGTLSGRQLLRERQKQISPETGGTMKVTIFSASQQGPVTAELSYAPLKMLYVDGVEVSAYEVKTVMPSMGMDSVSFETEEGMLLKTTALNGLFDLRLEDEAIATGPTGAPDMLAMSRVSVSGQPMPRQPIAHLELAPQIEGDLAKLFPSSATQRLGGTAAAPKLILDMLGPGQGPISTTSADDMARFTGSSRHVQTNDPQITALAAKLVQGIPASDAEGRAFAIVQHVYQTLEKAMVPTIPNAVQVLQMGKGDCGEHAVLTSALLRAAGLPTKTLYGLVYTPMYGQGFYYHAWNAVLIENRWLEVDSALGMFPADATHIVVGESDDLGNASAIHPLYGRLSFEVLRALEGEFEPKYVLRNKGF